MHIWNVCHTIRVQLNKSRWDKSYKRYQMEEEKIWCQSHEIIRSCFLPYLFPFIPSMFWIQIANFLFSLATKLFLLLLHLSELEHNYVLWKYSKKLLLIYNCDNLWKSTIFTILILLIYEWCNAQNKMKMIEVRTHRLSFISFPYS